MKKGAKENPKQVVTAEEVVEDKGPSVDEMRQMLRQLNQNSIRIDIVKFFREAVEQHLNPAIETKSEPPVESGGEGETSPREEKEKPLPFIQMEYDEDENATEGTFNFPEIKKSVNVTGNALMIALQSIESWAERLNLFVDPETDSSLSQRFPQLPDFHEGEIKRYYKPNDEMMVELCDSDWQGVQGLARLVLLFQLQENQTPAEKAAARFNIQENAPFDNLLDFVQFMNVVADKSGSHMKSQSDGFTNNEPQAAVWSSKFYYTKRTADILRAIAEKKAEKEAERLRVLEIEEEDRRKRYEIVEHVRKQMEIKEAKQASTVVEDVARKAQKEFLTQSMDAINKQGTYNGPPKYLAQRDVPLEIPTECIRKLSDAMDQSMDDRISVLEIKEYVAKLELPFEKGIEQKMFNDCISGRGKEGDIGGLSAALRNAPINTIEIAKACRGRHQFDSTTKTWNIKYGPYRNHWIVLLLTVNERIFAMPMPKVVPDKIKAQFEQEEDYQQTIKNAYNQAMGTKFSLGQGVLTADVFSPSVKDTYLKTQDTKQPIFSRNLDKTEGNIKPELGGLMKIGNRKQKTTESNPYEQQINSRINATNRDPLQLTATAAEDSFDTGVAVAAPKVSFVAKEMFEQAHQLCSQIPHWNGDKENPIHYFVPTDEKPYPDPDTDEKIQEDMSRTEREFKLSSMQGRKRTLQLAGTMALKNRAMSPLSKIRETRGFVTTMRVNDVGETKKLQARRELKKTTYEFQNLRDPVFRDTENALAFNQKDFVLRSKPDLIDNPLGLSEFNKLPKMHEERFRQLEAKRIEAEGLAGKQQWERNHPRNHRYVPMSIQPEYAAASTQHLQGASRAQFKNTNLEKDEWISAYLELARTVKDDLVVGKAPMQRFFNPIKTEAKNVDFTGNHALQKVII